MSEKQPTRRRWYQFSLRTLLAASLVVGLGCGWVGMQLEQKRRHERVANEIQKAGGSVYVEGHDLPAWKASLFGKYALRPVLMDLVAASGDKDSVLDQIRGMRIHWLTLSTTNVTDAGLAHLEEMTSIQRLFLYDTQVTDAGLVHLKGLTNLETLFLQKTQVTDRGLVDLRALTNLQNLTLANSQVTGAGLAHLKGFIKLEILFLDNTQVNEVGLANLKEMTKLETLGLSNISDEEADRIQQAIPHCRIVH